jgi:hypothetical protein
MKNKNIDITNPDLAWTIRKHVAVAKKPFNTIEVPATVEINLPTEIQEILAALPTMEDCFEFEDEGFFKYVFNRDQQFWIVKLGNQKFFVDTQGYQYARYVGELV